MQELLTEGSPSTPVGTTILFECEGASKQASLKRSTGMNGNKSLHRAVSLGNFAGQFRWAVSQGSFAGQFSCPCNHRGGGRLAAVDVAPTLRPRIRRGGRTGTASRHVACTYIRTYGRDVLCRRGRRCTSVHTCAFAEMRGVGDYSECGGN